ncbi:NUDIX hydrolase [Actinoplanes auranticolor]|nr:NUDIX hydrolase [Actinoplanes auranticolor]
MYANLRESHPALFANPPGAAFEILTEPVEVRAAEEARATDLAEAGMPAFMAETGVVYADPFFMVVRDAVRTPAGSLGTYSRVISAGNAIGVVILPQVGEGIVLVHHFRHSTRTWHLEIPRGFGMPGSDPVDDARRELLEEIGVSATALHDLGEVYPDSGAMGSPVRLFYAEVSDPPSAADQEEGIDAIRIVSPGELGRMIRDEEITDGFTITAYTRALLRGLLPASAPETL